MARTPFSARNAKFSECGHNLAKKLIYPAFFETSDLRYEYPGGGDDALSRMLDSDFSVDTVVTVVPGWCHDFLGRFRFTFQERWRVEWDIKWDPKQRQWRKQHIVKYGDITITDWNVKTNMPSELYKMGASYFLYGITDGIRTKGSDGVIELQNPTRLLSVQAINVADMLRSIVCGELQAPRRKNPRSNQIFRVVQIEDLRRLGLLSYEYPEPKEKNGVQTKLSGF